MTPRIEDSAFLPRNVNDRQKTVTLPLDEYERLVNAQKPADAEMRKAKSMIEKSQVQIVLRRSNESWYEVGALSYFSPKAVLPLDCLRVSGDDKVDDKVKEIIDEASNHVIAECAMKISECNITVKKCKKIMSAMDDYSKKGALYRFFNEFKW